MSELTQEFIKARAQARSWSLESYPGKVQLPSDILHSLQNPEAATKVMVLTVWWLSDLEDRLSP
jgi:sister-chromatid-cohesion protein PDS5